MALGYPTVETLQASMSSRQFAEWMAYYRLEPFGQDHQHAMMAQLLSILGSVHRDKRKHPRGFTPEDFMPGLKAPEDKEASLRARVNDAFQHLAIMARRKDAKPMTQTRPKTSKK